MKSLKSLFKPDSFKNVAPKETWEFAQNILDQFIEENGVKVRCSLLKESNLTDKHGPGWMAVEPSTRMIDSATHTAILLNIQPLKQCEHRVEFVGNDDNEMYRCYRCGISLKPKGWETV